MSPSDAKHHYRIRLETGGDPAVLEVDMRAVGPEIVISHLETVRDKRRAIIVEDGRQIADLTYLRGFWRVTRGDPAIAPGQIGPASALTGPAGSRSPND